MRIVLVGVFSLLLISCSEFFSEDVSDSLITINSPSDSLFTQSGEITFWWEEDRGMENYRFQLVSPSFYNPDFIFDTLMAVNEIRLELAQGVHSWRLRAENAVSESAWFQRFLVVDTLPPLAPVLISPAENDTIDLQAESLTFNWQSLDVAINGFSFPTRDSVFIYMDDHLLYSAQATPPFTLVKADSMLGVRAEATQLDWEIRATDQAGNREVSIRIPFFLTP